MSTPLPRASYSLPSCNLFQLCMLLLGQQVRAGPWDLLVAILNASQPFCFLVLYYIVYFALCFHCLDKTSYQSPGFLKERNYWMHCFSQHRANIVPMISSLEAFFGCSFHEKSCLFHLCEESWPLKLLINSSCEGPNGRVPKYTSSSLPVLYFVLSSSSGKSFGPNLRNQ